MENKVTRYSAAAVIVLAMTLVLLGPFGTPGNGGVVLAGVQQKVANAETMVIRGKKTYLRPGENGDVFEFLGVKYDFDVVKYFSKQHGLVEEGRVKDKLIYRVTFNRLKGGQTLLVLPPWKKYVAFTSTDKQAILLENLTPKGIVNLLVGSEYKELGRDNIDGVEVEGFEFQKADPFIGLVPKAVFDIQNLKGKIWVGIKEQLPVRVEADLVIGKSLMTVFNDLNLHEVNILDQYNVELDEDIFDTKPPEGYTELTLSDILPFIPLKVKAGITGLGLCFFIVPAGFIVRKRQRRKKAAATEQ
ncbi:MAG: hypothetical protein CEE38_09530 [Planctomycetes bacterium B3_Pla]|nr:MAG: hypothetical protein CEE38_09530 [Planctomycetes bacterium B3_Pla]